MLSDYVNLVVYDFWAKMQKAILIELAMKKVPLIVTGDGQEIITFICFHSFSKVVTKVYSVKWLACHVTIFKERTFFLKKRAFFFTEGAFF